MRTDVMIRAVSAWAVQPGWAANRDNSPSLYRRQTALNRRADGSVSTSPIQLRCVMLNIEVSRRRANRFYDPCGLRVGLYSRGGRAAMRDCGLQATDRVAASSRLL